MWDFNFPLPAPQGMYSGFKLSVDGVDVEVDRRTSQEGQVHRSIPMEPGATREVRVAYHSQGCDEWSYDFQGQASSPTRSLELQVKTNFADIDFPDGTLSPTARTVSGQDWTGVWNYQDLLSGGRVGISLPRRTDAAKQRVHVCLFAPLGLLGFFLVLGTLALVSRVQLLPLHYALLGAGYFSFHLLLAYLGDIAPLAVAFPVAAGVTYFVELSYLRKLTGTAFALRSGALALTLYLVLYSAAFLVEHRGLLLVALLLLSLHLVMQLTAKIDWSEHE